MPDALLYADGAAEHDARAGRGSFAAAAAQIRDGATAQAIPTLQNFWRLGRLARWALSLRGRWADLADFRPQDHQKLGEPWTAHLAALRERLRGASVVIGEPTADLQEALRIFDAEAGPASRANLLRLLGALSDGCFIGPHTFHLDIANACNTNCLFCGLHSPRLGGPAPGARGRRFTEGWSTGRLDFEMFAQLVDDLAAIGATEDVLFSGEGEPLTHPRIFEMLRLARAKGLGLTLFTNGLALDERTADILTEIDLDILYWSLSAASPATFAALQPAQSAARFRPLVDQFAALVRKKRAKNNKPYIILAHVINRMNAHECEAAMDLALAVGVDAVRYQVMHQCGANMADLLIAAEQRAEIVRQLERARRKAERAGVEIAANIEFQMTGVEAAFAGPAHAAPHHWSRGAYRDAGCLAGWFFGRSFSDGRLSFCCHDKIVGSLRRGRLRDIWFSERYRKLRQAAKAFADEVNPDLTDEMCGGPLLGPDCDWCGNYEFNNQALADLDRLGWRPLLRREPPAWP